MKRYGLSQNMCDWEARDDWRMKIRGILGRKEAGKVAPFLLLALSGVSAEEHRHCSELWMRQRKSSLPLIGPGQPRPSLGVAVLDVGS